LVLGIAMMVGVLGFLAWHDRADKTPPAPIPAATTSH
jgi:hypothetical protein